MFRQIQFVLQSDIFNIINIRRHTFMQLLYIIQEQTAEYFCLFLNP